MCFVPVRMCGCIHIHTHIISDISAYIFIFHYTFFLVFQICTLYEYISILFFFPTLPLYTVYRVYSVYIYVYCASVFILCYTQFYSLQTPPPLPPTFNQIFLVPLCSSYFWLVTDGLELPSYIQPLTFRSVGAKYLEETCAQERIDVDGCSQCAGNIPSKVAQWGTVNQLSECLLSRQHISLAGYRSPRNLIIRPI